MKPSVSEQVEYYLSTASFGCLSTMAREWLCGRTCSIPEEKRTKSCYIFRLVHMDSFIVTIYPRSGADYDSDPQDKLGNQIKREARLKARRANVSEAEGCNNFGSVS
ncbi:hypothetical protein ABZX51_002589 [Aspergillus tubingensis]